MADPKKETGTETPRKPREFLSIAGIDIASDDMAALRKRQKDTWPADSNVERYLPELKMYFVRKGATAKDI